MNDNTPWGYPDEIEEDYMECACCGDGYPLSILDGNNECPYCQYEGEIDN